MSDQQQGDVRLFQTDNDGDISITDGLVQMGGGLETSAYLSLFGGDEEGANWWANISEPDPVKEYNSETQKILNTVVPTSGNLLRVEDAANKDLKWMLAEKVASSITVAVSIPAIGRVKLVIDIEAIGSESRFEFTENWKARS